MIPAAGCVFLAGAPKSGKSWFGLDLALAVASGGDYLGRPVENPGRVLLVDTETPARQLQDRVRKLAHGRNLESGALAQLALMHGERLRLDQGEGFQALLASVMQYTPRLILLDCLVRFHGLDENSAQEMAWFLGQLRELTRVCDSTLVLVHHLAKGAGENGRRNGAGLRGSGDLWGWYDAAVFAKRDGLDITLEFESRFCPDQVPAHVRLDIDEDDDSARVRLLDHLAFQAASADRVLDVLRESPEGLTQRGIKDRLRASGTTVRAALRELKDRGLADTWKVGRKDLWGASAGVAENWPCPADVPLSGACPAPVPQSQGGAGNAL